MKNLARAPARCTAITLRGAAVTKMAHTVREMFSAIAPRYDLLNHLLSFNQDRKWRRILAEAAPLPPNATVLDICCGTGDVALELARQRNEIKHIAAVDFSFPMLKRAKAKVQGVHRDCFHLTAGDALRLPYRDGTFDAVVCAFGVRNFENVHAGLKELARVTRKGGVFLMLEFFPGRASLFGVLFRIFFWGVLPRIGKVVSGNGYAYSYLPLSVDTFYTKEEMANILRDAGYDDVRWRDLSLGIVTLFKARVEEKNG